VGPTITLIPKIAWPAARSSNGNTSNRIAWAVEIRAPPPMPWITRPATSISSDDAFPQRNEATVNRTIEPV
jgi:hypothetical protein